MLNLAKDWLKAAFHVSVQDGGLALGWGCLALVVLALVL